MHLTPHLLLSATDLTRFMGCPHATVLDLAHLRGEGPEPKAASEDVALLQKQGDSHGAKHLDGLKADGRKVLEILRGNLAMAAQATRDAMGRAARNIVLAGDPRQLPKVIQGAHPEPANLSCPEWMLQVNVTVPPDRGLFPGLTRRMHPAVNRYISEQNHEGRLASHHDTAIQGVTGTPFPDAGAFWVRQVTVGTPNKSMSGGKSCHLLP